MSQIVVLVTPQTDRIHHIGDAWEAAGASGVTVIESYGLHRLREAGQMAAVPPGILSMIELLRSQDQASVCMFSVVPEALVDALVAAADQALGGLDYPNHGILFVLELARSVGVREARK